MGGGAASLITPAEKLGTENKCKQLGQGSWGSSGGDMVMWPDRPGTLGLQPGHPLFR